MGIESSLESLQCRGFIKQGTVNSTFYVPDFTALVGERVEVITKVNLTWTSFADAADQWSMGAGYIQRTIGSFVNDGFLVGQSFQFYADWQARLGAPEEFTATIDTIIFGGLYMTFTVTSGSQATGVPTAVTGEQNIGIWADLEDTPADAPTALFFRWNLLPNGSSWTNISPQTNEPIGYYISGITNSAQLMSPEGSLRGWVSIDDCDVRQETTVYQKNNVTYEIVNNFVVTPFWLSGWLSDLQNGIRPSFFQGGSLSYLFQCEFRHSLNQTTGAKFANFFDLVGTTGWFDESFGGVATDYTHTTPTYTDVSSSNSVSALQKYATTTIDFSISRAGVNLANGQTIILHVSLLPDDPSIYQQSTTTLPENLLYDTIGSGPGAPSSALGLNIAKSLTLSISSGDLVVSANISYNTTQQSQISPGDWYMIWAVIEDPSISQASSNRAALIIDINQFETNPNSTLATWDKFEVLSHELDYQTDTGKTAEFAAWNEDGLLVDWEFSIDTAQSAVVTGIDFSLVAINSSTGDEFELDSYSYNLGSVITSGGIQQIDINSSRNYFLASSDQFKLVTSDTGTLTGTDQQYLGAFAQKIRWQDWLQNLAVNTDFYDNAQTQNNLNFKSSNYSDLQGYDIRIKGKLSLTGQDAGGQTITTEEVTYSPDLDIYDYGVSDDGWTGTIETFDPDTGANLGGNILSSKDTLFRVTWNHASTSLTDVYAIHRLEETGSASGRIYELSNFRPKPFIGNVLKGTTGNSLTTIAVNGSNIVTECLINHLLIDPGNNYNLSGRIQRDVSGDIGGLAVKTLSKKIISTPPAPAVSSFCGCDYWCEYEEPVFADTGNDDFKKDTSSFLVGKVTATDTVEIKLYREGVLVATITDSTYGTYYSTFTAQPLYVGWIADWSAIFTAFSGGQYQVIITCTTGGVDTDMESRKFRLMRFDEYCANGTVKIESYQSGNIVSSDFDFTDLVSGGWSSSIRVLGRFGNKRPTIEVDEFLNTSYQSVQNRTVVNFEYSLDTKYMPINLLVDMASMELIGNELHITDYSLMNPFKYNRIPVVTQAFEEVENQEAVNGESRYVVSFTDRTPNTIKRNY